MKSFLVKISVIMSNIFNTWVQKNKLFIRKIVIIFLFISLNICYGCLKEPSPRDGSFEYPQHTFWLRNEKKTFLNTHSNLEA